MKNESWTTHTLSLEDIELSYLTWGDPHNPPVLALHGYLDHAYGWTSLGEALTETHYVVAPHFRGHGDSGWALGAYGYWMPHYIADWSQLIEHLGWSQFDLVGHSMGANCASIWAGTYPETIRKLILVEGFGVPTWTADDTPDRLRAHIKRRHPQGRKSNRAFPDLETVAHRIRQSHPRYSTQHAEFLARYSCRKNEEDQWVWKFDPRVRIPNPAMYLMEQFRAFWKHITAPTLHIVGEDSPFLQLVSDDHWTIKTQQIHRIPRAMHMVHHEESEAFNRCVMHFLQK